ncbi:MAG TPA: hypothetical protein VLJ59_16455 [Mycobacteriales bacterium]|nr:hypothetical protein [Mycobacteriales bacterium]
MGLVGRARPVSSGRRPARVVVTVARSSSGLSGSAAPSRTSPESPNAIAQASTSAPYPGRHPPSGTGPASAVSGNSCPSRSSVSITVPGRHPGRCRRGTAHRPASRGTGSQP